jgi:drug/metabolite transporter (DMT)-like permease
MIPIEVVRRFGLLILGAALLIVGVVVLVVNPSATDPGAASPVVGGLLVVLGVASIVVGLFLRGRGSPDVD